MNVQYSQAFVTGQLPQMQLKVDKKQDEIGGSEKLAVVALCQKGAMKNEFL